MKIGIISDIHSNIQALDAVLAEFEKIKVDKIVCCGDIIGIGINPEETVKKLISKREKLIAVKGNHEQYLISGLPKQVHDDKRGLSDGEIKNHEWNHRKLSKQSKDFLYGLELTQSIEVDGKKVYIIHYPLMDDGTYRKYIKTPNIEECKELFKEIEADIYLFGHTHMTSINSEGERWYINVGSLGCPMNSSVATAGLLEIYEGKVEFININVEYDVKEVAAEIKRKKLPFYKEIFKIFYGQ